MPIIDIANPDIGTPIDTPQRFAVTPGKNDIDHGSDAPATAGDVWGAAFADGNWFGAAITAKNVNAPQYDEPGFNPWDDIKGDARYEPHFQRFAGVRNKRASDMEKAQIDQERENRRLLDAAPWYVSLPAQLAAGVIDLPTLIPGGAFYRSATGGIAIGRSALSVGAAAGASTALQEAGLHDIQSTRTGTESAVNIGASIFLGGLLGAGGAKVLSKLEWDNAVRSVNRDLVFSGPEPASGVKAITPIDGALAMRIWLGELPKSSNPSAQLHFTIHDADNNPVAIASVTVDGRKANVDNIEGVDEITVGSQRMLTTATAGPSQNILGSKLVRRALRDFLSEFPEVKELTGNRVSGARFGGRMVAADEGIPVSFLGGGSGGALTSAGAAAVGPETLAQNAIAGKMAGAVAASTAKLNPALRILQSPSAATRDIGTKLFENSIYLKKNIDGVASEPAAETLMKEWNAGLAKSIEATDEAFSGYVKSGGSMKRREFREAVGQAMRRNDESPIPEVAKVASAWRSQVFDPLKKAAIDSKLLPPDVTVETAASYFSRMWNRNRLIAQEGRFKEIVRGWVNNQVPRWAESFDKETLAGSAKLDGDKLKEYQTTRRIERDAMFDDPRQAGIDVADEVFNTLTGRVEKGIRPEFMTITARGPLKERTFNIPDHLVEEFLEHDVELVGRRYARIMGADVELSNKFGTPDMKDALQKVRDDYAKLRNGVSDEKTLTKLGEEEKADIRDLEALRDLLRGTRQESPIERNYGRIVRALNHVNYIRSMGEVVLASLTDAVRPAMVHGLGQFMQTVPQLIGNMKGIKLSVAEAREAGNVLEGVLGHRLATISEIIDPYASRGPVEAFLENMTNVASKWNGIRMWTDMMKSVASVMTQNRIIAGALDFGKIKQSEKAYLAYLGVDESMAGRIAKMFETHGETVNGVKVANTEEWTDAVAVRTYRAAMNKDVDSIIVQKSVADVPLFANTPTGKAALQFKSFALASHQKVLLRGLQEDQSRFVSGIIAMTAMGMMITYLKAISGNRPESQERMLNNLGWWIGEGLDRSEVFSVPMGFANVFERASGYNPIKSPIRAMDESGGISQKIQNRSLVGALAGPSAGMIDDAAGIASIPKRLIEGEEVTRGQMNSAERLLPFNSYYGLRSMLRYVINPAD